MKLSSFFCMGKFGRAYTTSSVAMLSIITLTVFLKGCSSGSRVKKAFKIAEKFVSPHKGKKWGPSMVYVPGGCAQMGGTDGLEVKNVTVSAYYISRCLVSNRDYLTYIDDLSRAKKVDQYKKALLDMNVWKGDFIWNDSLKDYPYARVFLDYPVVGVTYIQAMDYCKWLTEKEFSMIHKPVVASKKAKPAPKNIAASVPVVAAPVATENSLANSVVQPTDPNKPVEGAPQVPSSIESKPVSTELVSTISENVPQPVAADTSIVPAIDNIAAQPITNVAINMENEDQFIAFQNSHKEKLEQAYGEQMYFYRLPTEAEWEYAAKASIISQNIDGVESTVIVNFGNIKSSVRYPEGPNKGDFVGLFKRFNGNYKGIPGSQPTDAPTEQVDLRVANGFGLQGCYGNVWEITSDLYRHEPAYMKADYNPTRVDDKFDDKYDESSPLSRKCRVARGGSYKQSSHILRTYVEDDIAYNDVGFRIVSSVC